MCTGLRPGDVPFIQCPTQAMYKQWKSMIIIINVFIKRQNLVRGDYSKRVHAYTHTHTYTRTHAHTHTRTHARTRTHPHTHARARTHTHIHTRSHTHGRTHAHARTRTHTHVRTHTHTHTRSILTLQNLINTQLKNRQQTETSDG